LFVVVGGHCGNNQQTTVVQHRSGDILRQETDSYQTIGQQTKQNKGGSTQEWQGI
jgi:hypothetical protein